MELEIGIFQLEDQKSFLVICKFWPITSTKDVTELSTNVKYYLKLVAQKVMQLCKNFLHFYKKMYLTHQQYFQRNSCNVLNSGAT